MTKIMNWSMDRLCLMIVKMLLNKFDCFICIEGNRGLGKSTLAFHISKKVRSIMRKIIAETGGKQSPYYKFYDFKPQIQAKNPHAEKFVLYNRDDVINFFDKWHHTAMADEMINVAFNRDFWSDDQKNLIKLMNMNRDHCNLFIACVPQFQTLDNQIKNLCKIRITVARRGLAVIQTPNRTIYNKDKWDTANNERIEREWLKKGSGMPQYSKLNTFRGMLRFPPLSPKDDEIYNGIKVAERNTIKKDLGVKEENPADDPFEKVYHKLTVTGGIKNGSEMEGIAFGMGMTKDALLGKVRLRLQKENKPTRIGLYYWDKKARNDDDPSEFASIQS